jgi:hypothetical protein
MEKRVIYDQIEVTRANTLRIRFQKQVVDGEAVFTQEPHRSGELPPDADLAANKEHINAHLVAMGWPAPADSEWELVEQIAAVVWGRTPPPGSDELAARNVAAAQRDAAVAAAAVAPVQAQLNEAITLLRDTRAQIVELQTRLPEEQRIAIAP